MPLQSVHVSVGIYTVDAMAVQWRILKINLFGIEEITTMKCVSAKILKQ